MSYLLYISTHVHYTTHIHQDQKSPPCHSPSIKPPSPSPPSPFMLFMTSNVVDPIIRYHIKRVVVPLEIIIKWGDLGIYFVLMDELKERQSENRARECVCCMCLCIRGKMTIIKGEMRMRCYCCCISVSSSAARM